MLEIFQSVGVFLAGLVARVGVFVVMLAVLVLPALAAALILRAVAARRERVLGLRRVAGLSFRPDVHYAPGHTWLRRRSGGGVEIGVDDLAERLLPSVTAVELPSPGTVLARGDTLAVLHGGGRAVTIPAPVAGTVAGVNAAALRDPGLVKREGYGRGWLAVVTPADESFVELPRGDAAEGWLRRESARWNRFLEQQLGFAAADGGELIAPAPWLVGEEGWRTLVAEFLRP
jgi:glycine cleavage system H lipoate-binding protein